MALVAPLALRALVPVLLLTALTVLAAVHPGHRVLDPVGDAALVALAALLTLLVLLTAPSMLESVIRLSLLPALPASPTSLPGLLLATVLTAVLALLLEPVVPSAPAMLITDRVGLSTAAGPAALLVAGPLATSLVALPATVLLAALLSAPFSLSLLATATAVLHVLLLTVSPSIALLAPVALHPRDCVLDPVSNGSLVALVAVLALSGASLVVSLGPSPPAVLLLLFSTVTVLSPVLTVV